MSNELAAVLDNQSKIAELDTKNALDLASKTPLQLAHEFEFEPSTSSKIDIRNVVFAGMGGSALQAELATTWPKLKVPFVIVKDYSLPNFVNENTLVIAASYSGNTEETLSACQQALERGALIVTCSNRGKLEDFSNENGFQHVHIPNAPQPRMAVFFAYRALVEILVGYRLIDAGALDMFKNISSSLTSSIANLEKHIETDENPAKQLATKLYQTTPIIYSGPLMYPAAYKWKISFNENSKNTAWCNQYSELNHNEFIGWTSHPTEKPFSVINLMSDYENPRIRERFTISDRLLAAYRPEPLTVVAKGQSLTEHLLYLVLFGDFVSLYLGILNGVDPSPVDLVEQLKKELG